MGNLGSNDSPCLSVDKRGNKSVKYLSLLLLFLYPMLVDRDKSGFWNSVDVSCLDPPPNVETLFNKKKIM